MPHYFFARLAGGCAAFGRAKARGFGARALKVEEINLDSSQAKRLRVLRSKRERGSLRKDGERTPHQSGKTFEDATLETTTSTREKEPDYGLDPPGFLSAADEKTG